MEIFLYICLDEQIILFIPFISFALLWVSVTKLWGPPRWFSSKESTRQCRSEKVYVLGAQSCPILYNLLNYSPPGSSLHGILQPRILKGNHSLLQGIVPTQGLNPGLRHCRQILYSLSHQGNQRNGLIPGLERSSGEGNGNSSEKSHEQRCLVGYSPWGLKEVWQDLATK